jgi:glycerol kinase
LQIQADLIGIPIRRMQEADRASLRGAAFLAGSSGLLWDSLQEARKTTVTEAVFEPLLAGCERRRRRALWHSRVASELEHAGQFKQEKEEVLEK